MYCIGLAFTLQGHRQPSAVELIPFYFGGEDPQAKESVFRFYVERSRFFCNPWNVTDVIIVILGWSSIVPRRQTFSEPDKYSRLTEQK